MQTNFDAIIIGAGPAGASAAILLASAGWSVVLVEKQNFPRRKVCGECIAASNLPLLDALGIGSEFKAQAGPELRQVAMMRGARTVYAELPAADHPKHAWGRALGRETLDTLLLARARDVGVVVLQPCSVQNIGGAIGKHECTVRMAGSQRQMILKAPVAILAHGSWEPLPAARAEARKLRKNNDLLAFKANFRGALLPAGLLGVLAFKGGYGGIVLGDDGLVTLACCIRVDRLEALRHTAPGLSAGDIVEAMLKRECAGVAEALGTATRCGAWLASGPLAPGVRLQPNDTVFRIGNAAGEAHPIIGEGMSMALQSAWLLCAHLIRARPEPGFADDAAWQRQVHTKYASEWRRHFAPRLGLAAAFSHVAMRPAISRALFTVLKYWPSLLTRGAAWGGKIECAADAAMVTELSKGTPMNAQHWMPESRLQPQKIS
jgi:flavin-dependent dehydrogenase